MNIVRAKPTKVPLEKLIKGLVSSPEDLSCAVNVEVSGVKMDSRLLVEGDLFIACFGQHHDARDYIDVALQSGVSAVLAESGEGWQGVRVVQDIPVIAVDNLRVKISEIASRFYGDPSEDLQIIGITGTNGKTSCSHFIAQSLNAGGAKCGVMGTLGYGAQDDLQPTSHTTPDAIFTQKALAELKQNQFDSVVMEVSSVGLHQHRVAAVKFDVAVFTNLSRDHLDYHYDMEAYANSKRKLFSFESLRTAIINLDDNYALSMLDGAARSTEVYTYSLSNIAASVHATSLIMDRHGFAAEVSTPYGKGNIRCKLFGYFNVSNVLATIVTLIDDAETKGSVNLQKILENISRLRPVMGRMEIIGSSDEITAIVDYAHTPDALESALKAVRSHFEGDIWCVFGCGGNRDMGKRPLMGEVAENLASKLVITDDNPRNENGEDIVQQILHGISDKNNVAVIRDRAKAISHAISNARKGDIVLVAGKGHENYQDMGGKRTVFSDANHVRLAMQQRLKLAK